MRTRNLNRVSGIVLVLLSLTALLIVLWGYTQPPLPDEGTGAHLFQLSILLLAPTGLLFLASVDRRQFRRAAIPLVLAGTLTVLAFGALYYLEHPR